MTTATGQHSLAGETTASTRTETAGKSNNETLSAKQNPFREGVLFFAVLTNFWIFPGFVIFALTIGIFASHDLAPPPEIIIPTIVILTYFLVSIAGCFYGVVHKKLVALKAYGIWVSITILTFLVVSIIGFVNVRQQEDETYNYVLLSQLCKFFQTCGILNFFVWIITSHHNTLIERESHLYDDASPMPLLPIMTYKPAVIFLILLSAIPHPFVIFKTPFAQWVPVAVLVCYLIHLVFVVVGLVGTWTGNRTTMNSFFVCLCVSTFAKIVLSTACALDFGFLGFLSWMCYLGIDASLFWALTSLPRDQSAHKNRQLAGEAGAELTSM